MLIWGKSCGRQRLQYCDLPPVPAVSGHSSGHWSDASRLEVIESDQSDSACPQRPGSYPQRTPQELGCSVGATGTRSWKGDGEGKVDKATSGAPGTTARGVA